MEEAVGVVMSMGSPAGEGAEVLMVGVGVGVVMMGTVRAVILSSRSPPTALRGALSVEAIWSRASKQTSERAGGLAGRRRKAEGGEAHGKDTGSARSRRLD